MKSPDHGNGQAPHRVLAPIKRKRMIQLMAPYAMIMFFGVSWETVL
jgi:hypothetical protein